LGASLSTAVALATVAACGASGDTNLFVTPITNPTFIQTNLVSDISSLDPVTIDPRLVNAWGLAFSPDGALWVANNGTGTSTLYSQSGAKLQPTITIPS